MTTMRPSLKRLACLVCLAALIPLGTTDVAARNTRYELKIEDVKNDPRYAGTVPTDVPFYFGKQAPAKKGTEFGEFVTNRKSNSFGRSDEEACRWAMMAALKVLHDRALAEGGNAVINIVSYCDKNTFSSDTLYECHAGAFVAGVALKGTVVKLPK
ncbi:MAG TPA: hypothetical protein VGF43_12500 [Dongiaceae bacterium]